MQLEEIIKIKIKNEGPISFHDFMGMALYYPSLGYYNSKKNKIGVDGDYYTSPVLSSLFGEMIGRQLEEMWMLLSKKPFTIVEFGAGTGALCFDILYYLKNNRNLYNELKYCIIEKGEMMKQRQKNLLPEKVSWHNSINEIGEINGCILSNELLDNFPVHKVIMKDELMEAFVDYENDFVEVLKPADEELKNYFIEQQIVLPKDHCTEINLLAINWIKENAQNLNSGFVITIDYGFSAEDLYSAKRNAGTILCYKGHQVNTAPFQNIGEQDITAHVNFSALNFWGEKFGLNSCGFTSQSNFLRSLGLMNYLRKLEMENKENNRDSILHINKLLVDMGNKFKVFIQQKGEKSKMLTGMQFANPFP
ncbi:MAG TPA: SAM-dependent methyltransferase [Hanamia sp.]|nr:SAM-dependent methyltransferase [Hanamia sp.]